ncbi:transglycosylase SLT domain-containing protein [Moraxella oblonga]|uniref:transglycosylase SLT domain-containing protein n=1 Tax=Moraxella oblonga TaxID=200413 RepID=UPI0008317C06|nr:transglycosylase SLT domain-containing protein [Moraxella oblonga]
MRATYPRNVYTKPVDCHKEYHHHLPNMVFYTSKELPQVEVLIDSHLQPSETVLKNQTSRTTSFSLKSFKKSCKKYLLNLGILSLATIPVSSLMAVNITPITKFDNIINKQEMVVATTTSDSTLFQDGTILHGFGYDVARHYAEHLGVSLELKTFDSEQEALQALKDGEVDMALSTLTHDDESLATSHIACDKPTKDKLVGYGLDETVGFTFLKSDEKILKHSSDFLCQPEQLVYNQSVARFYDQTLLENAYSEKHFKRALAEQLPMYKQAFKAGAKKHNHDWRLLAVVSYQESHLNPNATSFTGVQGLMMLTSETAKELGVTDRTDPVQSIQGGAKYLAKLEKMFMDVPESERMWFVLASYNMGPNAVKNIQKELDEQGKDGNNWSQVYAYLANNAHNNSRYVQCMHYVTNIRTYLEVIKEMQV